MPLSVKRSDLAAYALANALCVALLVWALDLWRADLKVLLADGDALVVAARVKGLASNWLLTNPRLGAPFGLDLHDFPHPENLSWGLIRLLLWPFPDPIVALNIYFLLTFPLTTSAALFVLRQFGLSPLPAIAGSLLYAFAPYHFMRNVWHLGLAAYFPIPLVVMVILWICLGKPLLLTAGREREARGRSVAAVVICLVASASGFYYAFFSGFFLLVAGVYAAVRDGRRALGSAAILIAVLTIGLLINTYPILFYVLDHGENHEVAHRRPGDAEIYGLKIADLLLPVPGHRLPEAAELRSAYRQTSPLVNENEFAALGAVGALGLLGLLARQVFGLRRGARGDLFDALAMLALAGLLFGTMGGMGSVFAQLVTPQFRCLNRIGIFLSFFSLFAVSAALDRLRPPRDRDPRFIFACAAVLVLGILDQVSPAFVPAHDEWSAKRAEEAAFAEEIETRLPADSSVFQLPYVHFPDGTRFRMEVYAHLRLYLASNSLRWSFPAMHGRTGDTWQQHVIGQPVAEMVASLERAGFGGIYVDRFGYRDRGVALEQQLQDLLNAPPVVSRSGRMSFFKLHAAAETDAGVLH